ncbi:MAG: IS21 family transposase [Pseudohongiella sp.]|uniref:IS21 family transposase n=1 Tax=Pseudohongiella sp. TaxID=1979412 RepID=UPI0034A07477
MRKIKDILRLRQEAGLSYRSISQALDIGYGTVVDYLERAEKASLGWPLPVDLNERDLGRLLFPTQPRTGQRRFAEPDFVVVHQELRRKSVTKQLLWQEYRQQHPDDGYSYAQFCHRYLKWLGCQQRSMRQLHRAGEKLFVDYCGPTMEVVSPDTGEIRRAQIFVAVLGASNYTFACASWSQKQQDWLSAHVQALTFFGGVPEIIVPDNLKSAVRKTHRYEPTITASYQQLAAHYQCAIIPARPYKPKDKSKAEVAVQIVERWIMARLRHHTFFTLASLNQAIQALLIDLNERPFKKLPGSRRSQFEQLEKPALRPLPSQPYQYAEIKQARVHIDYHVEYDKHYYSVPHHLVKQPVEVHASDSLISFYSHGQRVASHARSYRQGAHSTCAEHMPGTHRAVHEWSGERFVQWANEIGSHTAELVSHLLERKRHQEQNYRSVLALLSNAKKYGRARLNQACGRALQINSPTRSSVESILKNGLDHLALERSVDERQEELDLDHHENVRGQHYYH